MGSDFTFVGNQYKIYVNEKEYRIDLLLFHRKLQSLIAIDLKIGEFEPEHKGKMEFYLSVLNDTVKLPNENSAIGIIISKNKDRTIVEYSLKTATLPMSMMEESEMHIDNSGLTFGGYNLKSKSKTAHFDKSLRHRQKFHRLLPCHLSYPNALTIRFCHPFVCKIARLPCGLSRQFFRQKECFL